MHKNTFVVRRREDRPAAQETEYPTVKEAFDARPERESRGVFIKARAEDGTFAGYYGPVTRP